MEHSWIRPFAQVLRGKQPSSKPGHKLLPREDICATEVVDGPREDGTCVIQRYRNGVPDGPPTEERREYK